MSDDHLVPENQDIYLDFNNKTFKCKRIGNKIVDETGTYSSFNKWCTAITNQGRNVWIHLYCYIDGDKKKIDHFRNTHESTKYKKHNLCIFIKNADGSFSPSMQFSYGTRCSGFHSNLKQNHNKDKDPKKCETIGCFNKGAKFCHPDKTGLTHINSLKNSSAIAYVNEEYISECIIDHNNYVVFNINVLDKYYQMYLRDECKNLCPSCDRDF